MSQSNSLPLCRMVQRNCDIADARYASDYTLCVYLLKMREYFRWEKGYALDAPLSNDEVGEWLTAREDLWEGLAQDTYAPLPVGNQVIDPFETEKINQALIPQGYVYSGGLGQRARPHFFLGMLKHKFEQYRCTVLLAAEECARDLSSPPAMTLGRTIFVRRDAVRRMLWEKLQEWRWNRAPNTMARALACYDFEHDAETSLETMTDNELEAVILHEIGEVMAGETLGETWHEMLASLPRSKAELMARAVRDHLADALSTLPALLARQDRASLHFYVANLTALRKDLFPSLISAYQRWVEDDDDTRLKALITRARDHWHNLAQNMLSRYQSQGEAAAESFDRLIEVNRL